MKYVKSKTKSRTTVGPLITEDKKVLTEEKDMAEELNSFFASVFTKEDLSQIPDPETEVVQRNMDPGGYAQTKKENRSANYAKKLPRDLMELDQA